MNLSFLPDLSALAILIAILLLVRRRHPQEQTGIWLVGLFITLVESVAHIFYPAGGFPPRSLHVIVLDCYLLAGLVFTWDTHSHPIRPQIRFAYLALNALPMLAVDTLYGMHIYTQAPYYAAILSGVLLAGVSSLVFRRTWLSTALHLCGWVALGLLIRDAKYREAVYWSLAGIYAVAAFKFKNRLPRHSTGRLAILTGFLIWALCFFVHPLIVRYREFADIASHIWNMQKSLISIGMILVMLEEQVLSNQWLALHDELTGLPNRRSFEQALAFALDRCRQTHSNLALLVLDLNGFKNINDTLGHQAGDRVLCGVASNLRELVGCSDTLARLGGDEFTFIAPQLNGDRTLDELLQTIRVALEKPLLIDGHSLIITASLGLAVYPDDARDAATLLRIADERMYTLKRKWLPTTHRTLEVPSSQLL